MTQFMRVHDNDYMAESFVYFVENIANATYNLKLNIILLLYVILLLLL